MRVSTHAIVVVVFLCALICSAFSAKSSQVEASYDFLTMDLESSDFSLLGNSSWADDSGLMPNKRVRLTNKSTSQLGVVWLDSAQIDAAQSWSVDYQWRFSASTNDGDEELGFYIQTEGANINVWPDYAKAAASWLSL